MHDITVIIPTYNECAVIRRQLSNLISLGFTEIIVVDGNSTDGTAAIARQSVFANHRLLETTRSRPVQMNAGAAEAGGEWLLFLHADTFISCDTYEAMLRTIEDHPNLGGGAFYLKMDAAGWYYSYLEWYSRWRSRLFHLPYGDQAIFVKRSVFQSLGGFREDHPILEDVEFVRRLKKRVVFEMVPACVKTSARRFESDGPFFRGLRNLFIQLLYLVGVKPKTLARLY